MLLKNVQHEISVQQETILKKTIKNVLNLFSEDMCIF